MLFFEFGENASVSWMAMAVGHSRVKGDPYAEAGPMVPMFDFVLIVFSPAPCGCLQLSDSV